MALWECFQEMPRIMSMSHGDWLPSDRFTGNILMYDILTNILLLELNNGTEYEQVSGDLSRGTFAPAISPKVENCYPSLS